MRCTAVHTAFGVRCELARGHAGDHQGARGTLQVSWSPDSPTSGAELARQLEALDEGKRDADSTEV